MNNNNFLDKLYGTKQNPCKIPMVMGTILLITAFLGIGVIANIFHKIGKKLDDEAYLSITKDLYVVVFVMITAVTIVTNCINFSEPYSSMVKGFTSAFAIYIAWDRLLGKWDKTNKEYEKTIMQRVNL